MFIPSIKDAVSVIFSISVIVFIIGFCIVDFIQTQRRKERARRDKEKKRER